MNADVQRVALSGFDNSPRPEEGESMDDFMLRTEHLKVAASLRRMAWATDRSVEEIVGSYAAAVKGREDA